MWSFFFFFFAGHFWQTKDPIDSNPCRNGYFLSANVLLFICQYAVEDYKSKAAVFVAFLTISHWAVSDELLYILTFTLSRLHCIGIYHISLWSCSAIMKRMDWSSKMWKVLDALADVGLILASYFSFLQCLNESLPVFLSLLTLNRASGWRCCDCEQVDSCGIMGVRTGKVKIILNLHFCSCFSKLSSFLFHRYRQLCELNQAQTISTIAPIIRKY